MVKFSKWFPRYLQGHIRSFFRFWNNLKGEISTIKATEFSMKTRPVREFDLVFEEESCVVAAMENSSILDIYPLITVIMKYF